MHDFAAQQPLCDLVKTKCKGAFSVVTVDILLNFGDGDVICHLKESNGINISVLV